MKDKDMTSQSIFWSLYQQPLALNKCGHVPNKNGERSRQWSEMRLITKLANNMNNKICIEDGTMCPFFRVQTINPIKCFQTGESCQHNWEPVCTETN